MSGLIMAVSLAAVCFSFTTTHVLFEWYCAPLPTLDGLWSRYHAGDDTSRACNIEAPVKAGQFDCHLWDMWAGPARPGEIWYKEIP